jgi:hypothetical protein
MMAIWRNTMRKRSIYFNLSAFYFILAAISIVAMDFLFCISLETAVKTGVVAVLFYLCVALLLAAKMKSGYVRKEKETAENKHYYRKHICRKRKNQVAVLVICFLLCILLGSGGYVLYENGRTEIPSSLTEFGEKYPEAQEFVAGYKKYINKSFDTNLRLDVTKGEIPLFIQWDKRWGYQSYGSNLLGIAGCGPTCISMVVCGLTGSDEWNPYFVAQFSEESGYYVQGVGTSWDLMTVGAGKLGLNSELGTVSEDYILNNLSATTPMICSMYPGDFTYTGHFIVLTGVDANGDIIVNDPNSRKNSEKHWRLETLIPQIRSIWKYTVSAE